MQQALSSPTGGQRATAPRPYWKGYLLKLPLVAIDEKELEVIELESTHTIDIDSFVPKQKARQCRPT
jgi:non-homologous end joining protein Ku